ncbi:MAG: hypothetical protein J6T34_02685 [Bacilli bacterium]|nr:hypothetical protein [Bacilli bacterium]
MPNYSDTRVNDMIFNVLDSAKYNTLLRDNQIDNNQLYLITDDTGSIAFYKNNNLVDIFTGDNDVVIDLTNAVTADLATAAKALNFVHTNELILGNNTTQSAVHINHRRVEGGNSSGNTAITDYYFKNGNGQTTGVTIHAASFDGNANSADIWKTGRKFSISDADSSNSGSEVTVNGSSNYTLPLPAIIKATLKGNADTATKATQDSNGKTITNEYLHRAANSSSTLNQFTGAPSYLLGIEAFADGGEVKWQSTANITVGKATTADTWTTARNFSVSDDSGANTGNTVSVNGGGNVTLPLPTQIYLTGNHAGFINGGETDKFFDFAYGSNPTTSSGASWRIGALNSGSGDTNYFVIQTGGSTTSSTAWNNALRIGMNTLDIHVGGNLNPLVNNSKTLGTSSLKWANVYATTFTGNLDGNAASATKWKDARNFSISDATAAHTGSAVSVDGSQAITLPLPATITATLVGNASTSSALLMGSAITTATNLDNFLEASKVKATIISTGVTYTGGTLSANDGEVISIGYSNTTYGNQIFFDPDTDKISVRRKSSTWKPWVDLIHTGNISNYVSASADKWTTARNFTISDSTASNTGNAVSVDGSANVDLKLPATIKATLDGNATTATNAAYQHYYYHDLFAFCRIGTPTLETTTNGSTWTSATLDKNIFDEQNLTSMTLFNNNITGYRWVWHSNNFSYSGGAFVLTSWSYTSPSSTQSVTLETSADGTTWTSRGTMTGNWSSSNGTFSINNYGSDAWIRVTILRTSADGTTRLANLRLLSARPGDQGQGKEYEYPYKWDANANVFPIADNAHSLGSSTLRWANIYGALKGNADSASRWATARNFSISDADATNTGTVESVDGTANVTLKLPSTIKAALTGNASSATKAYVTIADTTKFYLIGSTNTSSGNADLKEDTGLYAGTTKGQLGAAYVGINGDNTSYRLYVNGTSLMTGVVNINTSTGTLKIGSQTADWTHFEAQRDFYFNRQASINGNFLPFADLSYSLGDDGHRWSNVYANVLRLQGAASNPSTSAGARIEFTYDDNASRSQPVYIAYTPNDSYRAPAGLKIMGGTSATPAWFEVEGVIYASSATDSTTTSTGSIVASGGVGIAKQLRVAGATNLGGTLGVTGATTLASTLTVTGNTTLNGNLTVASNKTTTLGGTLTVSGIATFSNQIVAEKDTDSTKSTDGNASIVTNGGISVAKQLSAKMIKIDNGQASEGCQLKYNETNKCLEFIFS